MERETRPMVIITGYFKDESYGLLGPQMAATIINDNTDYDCRVLAVTNHDTMDEVRSALSGYFQGRLRVVGFSTLGGRPDLFELARDLKDEGAVTILAGPQAGPDYSGEVGWSEHPHRFKGLSDHFTFALQGPAQQIIPVLSTDLMPDHIMSFPGVIVRDKAGFLVENPPLGWDDEFLSKVDWQTLYRIQDNALSPLTVTMAQVLEQIGCPHAAREKTIRIDYPHGLKIRQPGSRFVEIRQKGCSFCDVAVDKGFRGSVSDQVLKDQLAGLPQGLDGRKIPFELINENPLFGLKRIFDLADALSIELSRIHLTLRADFFLKGLPYLAKVLETARQKDVRILLASIGFESFDDTILNNLNKGIDRAANLSAVKELRSLKSLFPAHLGYLKEEGANHGFIHPTPWDSRDVMDQIQRTICLYRLSEDVLPYHSTPLIIHHASGLGDWIRGMEERERIEFPRVGTTIGWWRTKDGSLI